MAPRVVTVDPQGGTASEAVAVPMLPPVACFGCRWEHTGCAWQRERPREGAGGIPGPHCPGPGDFVLVPAPYYRRIRAVLETVGMFRAAVPARVVELAEDLQNDLDRI